MRSILSVQVLVPWLLPQAIEKRGARSEERGGVVSATVPLQQSRGAGLQGICKRFGADTASSGLCDIRSDFAISHVAPRYSSSIATTLVPSRTVAIYVDISFALPSIFIFVGRTKALGPRTWSSDLTSRTTLAAL